MIRRQKIARALSAAAETTDNRDMVNSAVTPVHVRRSWRALFDNQPEAEMLARLFAQSQAMRESGRGTRSQIDAETAVLHPRVLGGIGVTCRALTTDAEVFDDTFVGLYHLPSEDVTLRDDAVVLDLGGNVGYTAAHYAVMLPRARVICVEMDAANAAAARKNLAAFGGRCTVVHAAAWRCEGQVVYEGTEAWGYRVSVLEGSTPTPSGGAQTLAPARTVDAILKDAGVDHVDFAKVDIEGAEAEVITTDAAWLRLVRVIAVEYHEPATRESMTSVLDHAGFNVREDARHPRCVVGIRKT